MRSDQHTVNALTAYRLETINSNTTTELYIERGTRIYIGIRVWIRHADGSETEVLGLSGIASAIAVVTCGTSGTYTFSAGFTVTQDYPLEEDDAIVVRVYADTSSPPTVLLAEYITPQLGGNMLNAADWTVYYIIRRYYMPFLRLCDFYFRFGSSGDPSRIEGFSYTTAAPPSIAKKTLGDGLVWVMM